MVWKLGLPKLIIHTEPSKKYSVEPATLKICIHVSKTKQLLNQDELCCTCAAITTATAGAEDYVDIF